MKKRSYTQRKNPVKKNMDKFDKPKTHKKKTTYKRKPKYGWKED